MCSTHIQDISEIILCVKQLEARVVMFSKIVHMLQLPQWKLILDCKTRWNSTYEILTLAIQYKEVFLMLFQLNHNFTCSPIDEDWEKLEKVCEILEAFNFTTNIILRSEYPAPNLFLQEVCDVKELLDEKIADDDDFIREMEYAAESQSTSSEPPVEISKVQRVNVQCPKRSRSWFNQFVRTVQTVQHEKSELDCYLEEGCLLWDKDDTSFDALDWWKVNHMNYRILSMMASEILAIPITMIASEITFSAGSRIINTYRSLLSLETMQVLLCGVDWCCNLYGVKKSYEASLKTEREKKRKMYFPMRNSWGVYCYQYDSMPLPLSSEQVSKKGFSEIGAMEHVILCVR
ncbi:zinc finger BED domain-containing protein RICESLEEPER 2-like [Pistacia vera]|uniref:zinc finger BED domain-containing protein RICESLEEPER 2-like n=1 Tax=Pistacia vera TaxID=55513 RepID=UPI001262D91E|nr:zinc finger BED domain-containing protein RICESLEEPER 2-like [Pistacia vera]